MSSSFPSEVEPRVSKVYSAGSREGRGSFKISPFRGSNPADLWQVLSLGRPGPVALGDNVGLVVGPLHHPREAPYRLPPPQPPDDHAPRRTPRAPDVVPRPAGG